VLTKSQYEAGQRIWPDEKAGIPPAKAALKPLTKPTAVDKIYCKRKN
jgi:hypothetical protein